MNWKGSPGQKRIVSKVSEEIPLNLVPIIDGSNWERLVARYGQVWEALHTSNFWQDNLTFRTVKMTRASVACSSISHMRLGDHSCLASLFHFFTILRSLNTIIHVFGFVTNGINIPLEY